MSSRTLAIALLAVAGCDQTHSGPIPIEALTGEMAAALCQQMNRCCTDADRARIPPAFLAILQSKDCARDATLQGFLDQELNLARLRESVQAGRARFDPMMARGCVDHLLAGSCVDWNAAMNGQSAALGRLCLNMVQGTLAEGAPCEGNFAHECVSGTCGFPGGVTTCAPAPGAGERCDGQCEDVFDCATRCAGNLLCSPENVCASNPPPRTSTVCAGS